MGYESRIYIVGKMDKLESDPKNYAEIIAVFNMCKFGAFNNIFTKETDCYIYADDGNTQILEDRYGEPLKETTIENVINYLEEYQKNEEYYRRVKPLLGLLKGFDPAEWRNLAVLHYGY